MGGTPDQPKEVAKPSNGGGFIALAIGLAFLITGLGSGIPGIHAALQDRQIIAGGVHAAGEVIRVEFRSSRYKVSAVQEVTFPAKNGEIYTAEARERYSKRNDPPRPVFAEGLIGNELTVFYDPSDPARNVVEDNEHSLASPLVLLIFLGTMGGAMTLFVSLGLIHNLKVAKALESAPAA